MNNLLIISATNDNNLDLSNKLSSLLADIGHVSNVISLEDYLFPLFGSGDNADEVKITELIGMIKNAEGLIFCGPEYNGCLLYTSPSPRDVEESRMPSSA